MKIETKTVAVEYEVTLKLTREQVSNIYYALYEERYNNSELAQLEEVLRGLMESKP